MTAICFYFQVHQPYRLQRIAQRDPKSGDLEGSSDYFDDVENRRIVERVAERCYLPMNAVLRRCIEATDGRFRCSFSISGTALQQMEDWVPEALDSFVELAQTGNVEFLCETTCHSLAALASPREFERQVEVQRRRVQELFGTPPRTFRNTELIITNEIARQLDDLGFEALLGEGADPLLRWRPPNLVYRPPGCHTLKLLLRSYVYSDDIAFRFSNREWAGYPLMADTFAGWLDEVPRGSPFIGLFMDYETFGEHQWADTGIFDFMEHLPGYILENPRFSFQTPIEVARSTPVAGELDIPRPISWADEERDLSAWLGNTMQRTAHRELYALYDDVRRAADRGETEWLDAWRKLTTSDHVYYMATKFLSDGDVHEYFSPYANPFDSYVVFMDVLDDLKRRVARALARKDQPKKTRAR